jgi:metal-sulfur cluster biosynthetic enzyme
MDEMNPQAITEEAPIGTAHTGNQTLQQPIREMLCTICDPEIPVNIYELGLIYSVDINDEGTPNCPVAESMPGEVENKVSTVPGVRNVDLELVWEPSWTPERMSEAAKLELGFI